MVEAVIKIALHEEQDAMRTNKNLSEILGTLKKSSTRHLNHRPNVCEAGKAILNSFLQALRLR